MTDFTITATTTAIIAAVAAGFLIGIGDKSSQIFSNVDGKMQGAVDSMTSGTSSGTGG